MPSVNRTFDSTGPILTESVSPSPGWNGFPGPGSVANLPVGSYFDQTLSWTQHNGAFAKMSYNMTAFYIYGSRAPGYGPYSITVDNQPPLTFNASASTPALQQLLYFQEGLPMQEHTVVFTNVNGVDGTTAVDIDFVTWTTQIGDDDSTLSEQFISCSDSRWNFVGTWNNQLDVSGIGARISNDWRGTSTPQSQAAFTFQGDAVTIQGAISGNHGPFSVILDNVPQSSDPIRTAQHSEVSRMGPLFYADNLGPGSHTIVIVNEAGSTPPQELWIQGANVTVIQSLESTAGATGTSSATSSTNTGGASSGSSSSSSNLVGPIVGAVCGGVFLICIIGLGIFLWKRSQKKRQNATEPDYFTMNNPNPLPPMQSSGHLSPQYRVEPFVASNQYSTTSYPTASYPIAPTVSQSVSSSDSSSRSRQPAMDSKGARRYTVQNSPPEPLPPPAYQQSYD